MSIGFELRHALAIAGVVQDRVSKVRIARALIEIMTGPPEFLSRVQALSANPNWQYQPERIDRTWSQADGIFYFVDLPPGDYRLRVSVVDLRPNDDRLRGSLVTIPPDDFRQRVEARFLGTRYGLVEVGPLTVPARQIDQPVQIARADVELSPTRIHGTVTDQISGEPIAGARVRLRGDTAVALTDDDGNYALTWLVSGKPTIEAAASHYRTAQQPISLAPGQDAVANLTLQST